jgi:glycosyltransferase involved in cell wall biosynthesis
VKVSIITVSYNAAETIRDTISSVLSQKGISLEYIIVDGGSKDETVSIVESFGDKIHQFISEPDNGIYDGMNKGVAMATGNVVGILNADDFYSDEHVLKKVLELFVEGVDAIYGDLVYVDQFDTDRITRAWKSGNYQPGAFKKGWMPPHPTFFVRIEIYEKFGSYSLELKSAADYEFMLRVIHKYEISLAYLPEIIVKMRRGGASNSSLKNRIKANQEDRMAWQMNELKPGRLTLVRKPLSKLGQFFKR